MPVFILLMITLFSPAAAVGADDTEAINKLIADINAGMKTNRSRMLRILVLNTDVAAVTLEAEKAKTGLSYGEIYVAHSLAMACHKTFGQIAVLKASGNSWSKIAQMHNVSLQGTTAALKAMLKEGQ